MWFEIIILLKEAVFDRFAACLDHGYLTQILLLKDVILWITTLTLHVYSTVLRPTRKQPLLYDMLLMIRIKIHQSVHPSG